MFDFELKYKHLLIGCHNHVFTITERTKLNEDIFKLITRDLSHNFKYNGSTILEFIEDYQDIIDWKQLIYSERAFIETNLELFVDKFNKNFDEYHWYCISILCNDETTDEFYKKYKDNLDWRYISQQRNDIDFDIDLLFELKDYIRFDIMLDRIDRHEEKPKKFAKHIKNYCLNHIEEILSYNRKDNTNEENSN